MSEFNNILDITEGWLSDLEDTLAKIFQNKAGRDKRVGKV